MTRQVLVAGTHYLLAAAFCARRLATDGVGVHWLVTGCDALDACALAGAVPSGLRARSGRRDRGGRDEGSRLHVAVEARPLVARARGALAEAWYFEGAHEAFGEARFVEALDAARAGGCRTLSLVREGATSRRRTPASRFDEACRARGLVLRELVLPLVAGPWSSRIEALSGRFVRFLWMLEELKEEIDARCPEYLELEAIRCRVPGDAVVELLDAGEAARKLEDLAGDDAGAGTRLVIGGPEITIASLFEQVGRASDIGLLASGSDEELNAVDRLFDDRLGEWLELDGSANRRPPDGCTPVFDKLLDTILKCHHAARPGRDARAAAGVAVTARRLDRGGDTLTYYAAGPDGDACPIVFINALGQGLAYWHRLLDEMAPRHRVVVWQLRGLGPTAPTLRTMDHVDDIEAILGAEGIERCHLVGWCTGAKPAVELALRRPDRVASIVFLNATFKDARSAPEGDTPYELNLVELCRAVDEHPILAGALRRSLLDAEDPAAEALRDGDAGALAWHALTSVPRALRPHVLEPFHTEATTIAYAKQVLDFIECDVLSRASHVAAPVLMLCCEHDAIASPSRARLAAAAFPGGRHVEVRGATHYCLYERPHVMADLLEEHFRRCGATGVPAPETGDAAIVCPA